VKGCSIYFEDRSAFLKIETATNLPMWLSLVKKLKISYIIPARSNNSGEFVVTFSLDFRIVNNFRKEVSHNTHYKFSLSNQLFVHSAWVVSRTVRAKLRRATYFIYRSQWPRVLRHTSTTARLLRVWVRIPPGAWMSVCC